jgi:hypothetical protein
MLRLLRENNFSITLALGVRRNSLASAVLGCLPHATIPARQRNIATATHCVRKTFRCRRSSLTTNLVACPTGTSRQTRAIRSSDLTNGWKDLCSFSGDGPSNNSNALLNPAMTRVSS